MSSIPKKLSSDANARTSSKAESKVRTSKTGTSSNVKTSKTGTSSNVKPSSKSETPSDLPPEIGQKSSKRGLKLTLKQLWILLWKSALVRKVHYISTFFELIGPILFVWVFMMIVNGISKDDGLKPFPDGNYTKDGVFFRNPQYILRFSKAYLLEEVEFFYAPPTNRSKILMEELWKNDIKTNPVSSEDEIRKAIVNFSVTHNISGDGSQVLGISFQKYANEKELMYKTIVPKKSSKSDGFKPYRSKTNEDPVEYDIRDDYNCYLAELMSRVDKKFLELFKKQLKIQDISLNRLPYPANSRGRKVKFSVYDILALFLLIIYTVIVALIVKRITDEKSTQSKELLRMIGMSDFVFWSAHFLNHLIVSLFQFIVFTIILFTYGSNPMSYTSPVLCFFIFTIFGIQMVLFAMLVTTVFNRPNVAVIVTVIIWLASGIMVFKELPTINKANAGDVDYSYRVFTSFFPTGSVFWLIGVMGVLENLKTGLDFTNLGTKTMVYGDFTETIAIVVVVCSYPIYIFLIWYLDNVWPFQFGVPKSPLFIFDPNYWFPKTTRMEVTKPETRTDIFEPDPKDLQPDIEIQNVTKIFGGILSPKKTAVDHLWLNIYHKQLTVLLGHNGAGKSTLMNMITGMFTPTSGEIYVNGYNIITNTSEARRSIGLCPQENILFKELTVVQHLKLFAVLKDCPYSSVESETQNILKQLQLEPKAKDKAFNLSGGMKRKLQLGLALIGSTNILILDEPTSGMDPEARRVIWDFLISLRREKTILLTTHFMEEADVLGDRIAIMGQGKLSCSGSPYFLKNVFGTGYQLRVEKGPNFDSEKLITALRKFIGGTKLKSEMETEAIYTFSQKQEDKQFLIQMFPSLFRDLETNRSEYGISSFGLTYSTLEDVFLAVDSEGLKLLEQNNESTNLDQSSRTAFNLTPKSLLLTGFPLISSQFIGLMMKRIHYTRRFWLMAVLQLLIPSIIIAFALLLNKSTNTSKSNSTKLIELNVKTIYGSNTKSYYQGSDSCYDAYRKINTKYDNKVYRADSKEDFQKFVLKHNKDINEYIMKSSYGLQCFEGKNTSSFAIWFNPEQTFSLSLAVITFFETLMSLNTNSDASIAVGLLPLQIISEEQNGFDFIQLIWPWIRTCLFLLPISFLFLAPSYVLFPIQERVSKSKLIQMMTGLSPVLFWICSFLFDLIYHFIVILILYLIIFICDTEKTFFQKDTSAPANVLLVILFAFGFAIIPFTYLTSLFFEKTSSAFVFLVIFFFVVGFIGNIFWSVCDLLINVLNDNVMPWSQDLLHVVRLIPIFSLLYGYQKLFKANSLMNLCRTYNSSGLLSKMCKQAESSPEFNIIVGCCHPLCEKNQTCFDTGSFSFGKFGLGPEIVYLFATGILYFFILIIYETCRPSFYKFLSSLLKKKAASSIDEAAEGELKEDSDVGREKSRVKKIIEGKTTNDEILMVHDLTKYFGSFKAVDHLCFSVHKKECFGLLGVNGAGKTTTFSMLTGDLFPDEGCAYINGDVSLIDNLRQFQTNIGYCPQFDCLLDNLSGEETLYMMGRLRGVPAANLDSDVSNLIKMVDLQNHAKKKSESYSGGNKRKLSLAVSMIGNPSLLFLDEPTTGVDPGARRKIWKTLEMVKASLHCAIVLTSHSMDECEALCARIGIMVAGKFRCLGSTQHLRSKYGQGYTVLVRLKREYESDQKYFETVKEKLSKQLPSAKLTDSHQCLMTFHVSDTAMKWSGLFEKMTELDQELNFEDYVISDATLESIFIKFAQSRKK